MLAWFKRKTADPKKALTDALGDFELPTFPAVVLEALSALRDPNRPLADVGQIINNDPRSSARLLSIANSAAYALKHPVRDVEHAASLLGRSEVESLLLSVGVQRSSPRDVAPGYEPKRFWQAAGQRAAVARALAMNVAPSKKGECFTAALLQDMAIPFLATARTGQYAPLLQSWHAGESELWSEEEVAFGFNHASVAGWMCSFWKFPDRLRDCIGCHHDDKSDSAVEPAQLCINAVGLLGETEHGKERFIELLKTEFLMPSDKSLEILEQAARSSLSLAA